VLHLAPGRRDVGVPALRHPAPRELHGALVERRLELQEEDGLLDVEDLRHERSTVAGMEPWIDWVRRLQAVSEAGLEYATDPYDLKRYEEVARLAGEVAGQGSGLDRHGAGHPTPKVDVRGALVRDGRVLMVREVADGGWTLPGGWADIGEPPSASVEREVREESGVAVRAVKLIAVHDRDRHNFPPHAHHIFKLFFLVEETGEPHGEPDDEVDGVGWFGLSELPPLSSGRTTRGQLELALAHAARPERPTDFD
jgi:ADP-ribose pyrophosphatase YjhB (NUDIX family)